MSLANNIVAIGCAVFSKNVLRIVYRVAIYFILKYGQIPILFCPLHGIGEMNANCTS